MIRLADEQFRPVAAQRPPESFTSSSWKSWEQGLEQWVRTRPGLALALAATAGAILAWTIKRRSRT